MTREATSRCSWPLPRHEARRRALEVLYEADLLRREISETLRRTLGDPHASPLDDFARYLAGGVAERCEEIDALIATHARGWSVARMPVIDRNILRLGVYELLHAPDTPPAVVIDEAVELAKEMSTEDSPRYVNGVLSAVLRNRQLESG
ncbi:MAG: transcription antitermination factor NusB [Actinomycetota bacterium]|nr:transcription antitermination factor NusB [Actinomycetota bacterium]